MPTSTAEGKDWIVPRILDELPGSILDVGAGEGTYATYITAAGRRDEAYLIALEIHEPYVDRYALDAIYDMVIVADARAQRFPRVDVVILGDVIEHFAKDEAQKIWIKARRAARKVVLASIPLGNWPQGEVDGNEHERHRSIWSNESVHALGGVAASWTGRIVGCYAAVPL